MAITLLQLSQNLNNLASFLEGPKHAEIMTKVANEALQLIRLRVQNDGENSEGQKFPDYSKKPMLAGRKSFKTDAAFRQIAGSKDKRKELKWVTLGGNRFEQYMSESSGDGSDIKRLFKIPGGYAQFRELHGRQSGFVDFTFTGRMWNNIKLVSDSVELQSGVAVIKATEPEQQKKLEGNTKRKGDILKLSKSEEKRISELYEQWVENALRRLKLI